MWVPAQYGGWPKIVWLAPTQLPGMQYHSLWDSKVCGAEEFRSDAKMVEKNNSVRLNQKHSRLEDPADKFRDSPWPSWETSWRFERGQHLTDLGAHHAKVQQRTRYWLTNVCRNQLLHEHSSEPLVSLRYIRRPRWFSLSLKAFWPAPPSGFFRCGHPGTQQSRTGCQASGNWKVPCFLETNIRRLSRIQAILAWAREIEGNEWRIRFLWRRIWIRRFRY